MIIKKIIMYYLKCNRCDHLNIINDENLLFCEKCNKKLENNFRDWYRINAESSFDDYKKQVCIFQKEILSKPDSYKKTKSLKYWIGFAVALIFFSLIGKFGGEKIFTMLQAEKTSKDILAQNWIAQTYGDFGLVVETPEVMTEREVPLPISIKQVVEKMQAFEHSSSKGFKVFINSAKYKPIIQKVSLQGAANGSVNEMKMQQGVTNFEYSEEKVLLNNINGFKQVGKFNQNGISIEFINTGYIKGLYMWQIMVAYESDDKVGKIAAKRVIESVKIENF